LWNARARNTHVEATLNLSCPAQVDARKKALLAAVPAMASDDLYRASVQRNDAGDAQHLVLEFLGPLPAIESSDADEE
jgi:hypothetical protein